MTDLSMNPAFPAGKPKRFILLLATLAWWQVLQAQPVITSFTPTAGTVGSEITINGNNFSPVAANNIVYFGRVRAAVNTATATTLKVTVPLKANHQFITVTTNRQTAFSAQPFTVVSGGALTATSYPTRWGFGVTGNYPAGLVVGDWNDDGNPDLIGANFNSANLSLFQLAPNTGVPEAKLATGGKPEGLAFGDLDSDGRPDLVATSIDDRLFSVFRNTSAPGGAITFVPRVDFPAGAFNCAPRGVAINDLDGDGRPDVVLAGNNKWIDGTGSFGTLSIQRNTTQNGSLSFVPEISLPTGEYPRKVAIADLDGDGRPDLAVTNHISGSVTIYRNTSVPGAISFAARTDYPTGTNPEQLAIGDLNGDGKPDLVVSNLNSSTVSVFKNTGSNGAISFGAKQDLSVINPLGVALGDLSGDGRLDLVVASFSTNKVAVFPNNSGSGNISFAPKLDYDCGNSPVEVSIGDINGDGNPDIALTNSTINFISVLLMEPPVLALNLGPDQQYCQGDSAVLTASLFNATYQWSTGATTNSITVKQSGSYWLRALVGGVTLSDTVNVSFKSPPSFSLGSDTAICQGEQLLLQPGLSNTSYLWQNGTTASSMLVTAPGTYWLQANKEGCKTVDTIKVSYKPLPHMPLGSDTAFCAGTSLLLDAADPSVETYTWQNGSHLPAITIQSAGTAWVRVRGWNGCTRSDTIRVVENAAFTLGKDTTLCEGASLTLAVGLTNAAFLWSDGSTRNQFSVSSPGHYWLQATQAGCTHRDSILVSFQPPPIVSLGRDTALCEGQTRVLNVSNPNATYTWNTGTTSPSYTVQQPGTYWVAVSRNGCTVNDTVQIRYTLLPRVNLGPDTVLCAGQTLTLDPRLSNLALRWQDGSTASSYTVTVPGQYSLTATNHCGAATGHLLVTGGLCIVAMPNAFTPNGDGKNDRFRLKYTSFIQTFRMTVYNRWGQIVFSTTDAQNGWDGTANGLQAPAGNYVWTIAITDNNNQRRFFRGNVMLIR